MGSFDWVPILTLGAQDTAEGGYWHYTYMYVIVYFTINITSTGNQLDRYAGFGLRRAFLTASNMAPHLAITSWPVRGHDSDGSRDDAACRSTYHDTF